MENIEKFSCEELKEAFEEIDKMSIHPVWKEWAKDLYRDAPAFRKKWFEENNLPYRNL